MEFSGLLSGDVYSGPPHYSKSETMSVVIVSGLLFTSAYVVITTGPTRRAVGYWFESQVGKTLPKQKLDITVEGIALRVVTCLHNAIVVPLALWALLDQALWDDPVGASSPVSETVLGVTAGFFVFDASTVIGKIRREGIEFLVHGVFCAVFFLYAAWYRAFHFYGCAYLLWELSTAFVHIRWLLHELGQAHTKLYLASVVAMISSFFACRILWGSFLSVSFCRKTTELLSRAETLAAQAVFFSFRICCVLLNGLNWYWFSKMLEKTFQFFLLKLPKAVVFNEKEE